MTQIDADDALMWTTGRLRCRNGTGTCVLLTAAAFVGLQCEWAAVAAAAVQLSGMKNGTPKMRQWLRTDYAEIHHNYAEIPQTLRRNYADITQSLRSHYAIITQSLRNHYAVITQPLLNHYACLLYTSPSPRD